MCLLRMLSWGQDLGMSVYWGHGRKMLGIGSGKLSLLSVKKYPRPMLITLATEITFSLFLLFSLVLIFSNFTLSSTLIFSSASDCELLASLTPWGSVSLSLGFKCHGHLYSHGPVQCELCQCAWATHGIVFFCRVYTRRNLDRTVCCPWNTLASFMPW